MACHYYGTVATSNMLLKQLFLVLTFVRNKVQFGMKPYEKRKKK